MVESAWNKSAGRVAYDGLDRLIEWRRGTLDGEKDGLSGGASKYQTFTLEPLGNWASFNDNGTTQARTHGSASVSSANEITAIAGSSAHVGYDLAGNMTKMPRPGAETANHYTCTYDAWNRLVRLADDSGEPVTIAEYHYDGLHRRIAKLVRNAADPGCPGPPILAG